MASTAKTNPSHGSVQRLCPPRFPERVRRTAFRLLVVAIACESIAAFVIIGPGKVPPGWGNFWMISTALLILVAAVMDISARRIKKSTETPSEVRTPFKLGLVELPGAKPPVRWLQRVLTWCNIGPMLLVTDEAVQLRSLFARRRFDWDEFDAVRAEVSGIVVTLGSGTEFWMTTDCEYDVHTLPWTPYYHTFVARARAFNGVVVAAMETRVKRR